MNKAKMKFFWQKMKNDEGFTLIELLVSIFIFSVIVVGIVSVFISTTVSYQKSRAIKTVKESAQFAMSSIAKDVRMGKIENGTNYATGSGSDYLLVSRNRGGRVCYRINSSSIGVANIAVGDNNCSDENYNNIVDLSGSGMTLNSSNSKFRSCLTDIDGTGTACNGKSEKRRGWVEMNFDFEMASGNEMGTDKIIVQTAVSSRDYGWEDI